MMDDFLIRENTGSIKRAEHKNVNGTIWVSQESNLFQNIEERKHIIGYLIHAKSLDPFKRGTKEPARIAAELEKAKWCSVKYAPVAGRSMWD
jgi:hypothetical protein